MSVYGRTWWGKKWLEAFNGIDQDNRLPRGRSYAKRGAVHDIKINNNIIAAKVQGSRPRPYKVEIILNEFTPAQNDTICHLITHSVSISAKLINKQLPSSLLHKLSQHHIKLFPSQWREIKAHCSCPDWAVPCKHIAAVIYLIAAEIDRNPFMVFTLHNCHLLDMIGDFNEGKLVSAQKIKALEELFEPSTAKGKIVGQAALAEIDLSAIPNLGSRICNILTNDPLFYENNFREILQLAYKHWQRSPLAGINRYPGYSLLVKDANLTEEDAFRAHWGNIVSWPSLSLVVDDTHRCVDISNGTGLLFEERGKHLEQTLVRFLTDIPNSMLHKLNPSLRLLHMLNQYAYTLFEHAALIPQILQNKQGYTFIRWIPALFDPSINGILKQLSALCPQQLMIYKTFNLRPEEQIISALSILLAGYMVDNLPSAIERHQERDVFKLFFKGYTKNFADFSNKEIPQTINVWLSRLYLAEKPHKLYLMVEDKYDAFDIDIQVSLKEASAAIRLQEALSTADNPSKLSILADLAILSDYIPDFEWLLEEDSSLSFSLADFTPVFLNILPVLRLLGITIVLPKPLQKVLKPQLKLNLSAKGKIKEDRESFLKLEHLLEFNWNIAIGDQKITIESFKQMLKDSRGLVRIMDHYVLLDEKEMEALLKKLDRLPSHLTQNEMLQAGLAGELMEAEVMFDRHLEALFKRLNTYQPVAVPSHLTATLRPYQVRGFSWLVQNIELGFGSIIADDMGLGKTLQVIAAILYCKNNGLLKENKVLIVAPTSLLSNWQKEVERFAPHLQTLIYHGHNRELITQEYDIVLTSYGLARRDKAALDKIEWFLLVLDEAQNIKNPHTEQTKSIKRIKAHHKIAMSGTPVENRLLEYWSIFDFTNKHYLGSSKQFKEHFATPIERERNQSCLERFIKITNPFILRRLKSDKNIIQDLPEKIEANRYCHLTAEQTALYQEVVDMTMEKIEQSEGIERKGLVLKLINALKQICNHPSHYGKKRKATIEQSGKMQILEEIMGSLEDVAEKALIFTQYVEMGHIISSLLEERYNLPVPFLHGGLSRQQRDSMVHDFQTLSPVRTLVVSLKAGGTGLNLTAASHVIHYDLWWNPAVEAQATDRAYRIGQKRNVMVHRLLTTHTFEERIDAMIQSKKELANLTVRSGEQWVTELTNNELRTLVALKKAA